MKIIITVEDGDDAPIEVRERETASARGEDRRERTRQFDRSNAIDAGKAPDYLVEGSTPTGAIQEQPESPPREENSRRRFERSDATDAGRPPESLLEDLGTTRSSQ